MKMEITSAWILILCFLSMEQSISREHNPSKNRENRSIDSVWIWEVKTEKSVIFIAGEQHDHVLLPQETLSHELAETAQKISSQVFLEGIQVKRFTKNQLRDRIDENSWTSLRKVINQSLTEKQKATNFLSDNNLEEAVNNILSFVNRIPNHLLLREVSLLINPVKDINERMEEGFLMRITKNKDAHTLIKNKSLESNDAVENKWLTNCAESSLPQNIVDLLLKQAENSFKSEYALGQELTREFRRKDGTAVAINSILESSEAWKIHQRCDVVSRNIDWMKMLKPAINESTKPIMIVAGIGHVVGEKGLLKLLCAEGYCESKRLLTVEEISRSSAL